jgi:CBS domain-containing protein
MTTDVITLTPETRVRDALEVLGRRHVSGAPVVEGEKLVGVISATDLMSFAAALPGVPTEREMSGRGLDDDASSVAEDVEDGDEAGSAYFVELWDDVGADVSERVGTVEGPEWNALEEHDVSEAMTAAPLVTLSPDVTVEAAAQLMAERAIHRVLVTENGKLVGIVSVFDVAKAVAEHRLTRRTFAFNHDEEYR